MSLRMINDKFDGDDGIDLTEMERFLPGLAVSGSPPSRSKLRCYFYIYFHSDVICRNAVFTLLTLYQLRFGDEHSLVAKRLTHWS